MSPPASKMDGDKKGRKKMKRARKTGVKIRVHLPPIESYEKEVDFRLEGSGRVIVRLERLMGSDRVRLTDAKFMALLLQKLEEEENIAWLKRTKERKKAEHNRSRKLAIEGLMDPGPDMQDLLNHPVFRVNKVLKKLAQFDVSMSVGQVEHLPPIIQTEPFEFDESGAIFKTYPRHGVRINDGVLPPEEDDRSERKSSATEDESLAQLLSAPGPSSGVKEQKALEPGNEEEDEEEEEDEYEEDEEEEETAIPKINLESSEPDRYEEWGGEGYDEEMQEFKKITKVPSYNPLTVDVSLTALQQNYGIRPEEDLRIWEGFKSDLVDMIYRNEDRGILSLYQMAEDIINVYERENLTVDEFVIKLGKIMRDGANSGKE